MNQQFCLTSSRSRKTSWSAAFLDKTFSGTICSLAQFGMETMQLAPRKEDPDHPQNETGPSMEPFLSHCYFLFFELSRSPPTSPNLVLAFHITQPRVSKDVQNPKTAITRVGRQEQERNEKE